MENYERIGGMGWFDGLEEVGSLVVSNCRLLSVYCGWSVLVMIIVIRFLVLMLCRYYVKFIFIIILWVDIIIFLLFYGGRRWGLERFSDVFKVIYEEVRIEFRVDFGCEYLFFLFNVCCFFWWEFFGEFKL